MTKAIQEPANVSAAAFAAATVSLWDEALGLDLLGIYLIGSLAHGGFSRRYSDVDVIVISEAGLSPRILDQIQNEAATLSSEWGAKLSVFWADRNFGLGRCPPLDRIDYLDHAVKLKERQRVEPARPTLAEIQRYLADVPFANWVAQARHFAAAESLEPKDRKAYLRTLLYPARFCYSWITGRMGSNDDAVAFLRQAGPAKVDLDLISRALECRQADADPDPLFSERMSLPSQVAACAALMVEQAVRG